MDELNNLPSGGTDTVEPHDYDNVEPTTYWDPDDDEEQDTSVAEQVETTDEAVSEEPAAEQEAPEEKPALISLPDGSQVTLEEATKGYMRQADFTRKTQEIAQRRQAMEADLQRIEGITQAFIDHLSSMTPAAPDEALVYRDPQGYLRQKVQYDAAMKKIQELVDLGSKPKEILNGLSAEQRNTILADENRKLVERFPIAGNQEGRQKFMASAAEAAQEAGFSLDDLNNVSDHRLFVLAHWANEGLKAAKAREKATAKVANVPPATPRKPGQPAQANRNADAMRKLARSGSIKDALKVDWD